MKKFFFGFATLAFLVGGRTAVAIDFSVECESPEHHVTHAGQPGHEHLIAPDEEVRLVRDVVKAAYPGLPQELKDVARAIGFVIVHKDQKITRMFQGCSAEDDPYYRFPDQTLYHPRLSPHGTIRLAVTERFVAQARLLEQIDGTKFPEARAGADAFFFSFIAHELLHARQYQTRPVPDGLKTPGEINDGLMSPTLLAGARAKVQYEQDAFELHRRGLTEGPLLALAKWCDDYAAANPALFAKDGIYSLLGFGTPGWIADSYYRGEIPMLGKGGEFNARQRLTYEGQVVPGEVVAALVELNTELKTRGTKVPSAQVLGRVQPLLARWGEFMDPNIPANAFLTSYFTFRLAIEDRFWREIAILQSHLAPDPKCSVAVMVAGLQRTPTKP